MKPPFCFEAYRDPIINDRNKRISFTKSKYQPSVRNEGWQGVYESWPFDNDVVNSRTAHYNHLGRDICHCYATTTSDMYGQIKLKGDYFNTSPDKKVTSYFSFKDSNTCKDVNMSMFPEICASDYITTTQKHYTPPYPALPHTVLQEETPFMAYRMMKRNDPGYYNWKFWDEGFLDVVKRLQCYKAQRQRSYDFCKGIYTDGGLPPEKRNSCIDYKSM